MPAEKSNTVNEYPQRGELRELTHRNSLYWYLSCILTLNFIHFVNTHISIHISLSFSPQIWAFYLVKNRNHLTLTKFNFNPICAWAKTTHNDCSFPNFWNPLLPNFCYDTWLLNLFIRILAYFLRTWKNSNRNRH